MKREVNKYLLSFPVESWQVAKIIGSETNWKILETLRGAGINGLTVEELAKKTRTPKSTVYSVLSKLQAADWVESSIRRLGWGRPTKEAKQRFGGKPARIYIQKVPWGAPLVEEEFYDSFEPLLEKHWSELKKLWLIVLDEIVAKYKTDKELEEFFPKDAIHEECGWSHEALEFLIAICYAMVGELLDDDDFDELAKKHGFAK